jgi:surface antigen
LLRAAQALGVRFLAGFQPLRLNSAALLCACATLSACASGGFSLKQAEVDHTFYTSDIPAGTNDRTDLGRLSDEATIRNAVTSADIESLGGGAVAWANADTGARGSITGLVEYKDKGVLCRRFSTSLESFNGVALFKGEACLASAGAWRMQRFEAM